MARVRPVAWFCPSRKYKHFQGLVAVNLGVAHGSAQRRAAIPGLFDDSGGGSARFSA
jgi:hypothetical protein